MKSLANELEKTDVGIEPYQIKSRINRINIRRVNREHLFGKKRKIISDNSSETLAYSD